VQKLEELRCRYAQGYHVAKPLSASDVEAWVATAKPRSVG
jgi:EAL domain-containing protein (putative c-di-GMP-specific phosphodiesterase class I)